MKNQFFFFSVPVMLLAITGCSSPAGKAAAKVDTVEIKQMQFQPATLELHKGDTVVFKNEDMVAHDITEATSKKWSSGPLPAGSSWKTAVNESADYYCSIHQVMKGKLKVE